MKPGVAAQGWASGPARPPARRGGGGGGGGLTLRGARLGCAFGLSGRPRTGQRRGPPAVGSAIMTGLVASTAATAV
jgi:hypothetical protein